MMNKVGSNEGIKSYSILWRPLIGASLSSWCVEVSRGLSLLSRGFRLVAPSPPAAARSRPAVRYILDVPQSSPSLSAARSTASPTPEYSTTAFQVHRGGSNPLVLSLSRSLSLHFPSPGVCPRSVPVRPSVRPTRNWHRNAGFLLGKGRSDRRTGTERGQTPGVGTRREERR